MYKPRFIIRKNPLANSISVLPAAQMGASRTLDIMSFTAEGYNAFIRAVCDRKCIEVQKQAA